MPTLRKVAADTAQSWAPARAKTRRETPPVAWLAQPATLFITTHRRHPDDPLRPGDVLRVGGPGEEVIGVVIEVHADGRALLAIATGGERWIELEEFAEYQGRVKGVSRIDQPKKVIGGHIHGSTHSWFVRVYEGRKPKMTCSFSDASLDGRRASLRAALAYYAAHVSRDASEGIEFV